jgi:hypothetical protein
MGSASIFSGFFVLYGAFFRNVCDTVTLMGDNRTCPLLGLASAPQIGLWVSTKFAQQTKTARCVAGQEQKSRLFKLSLK